MIRWCGAVEPSDLDDALNYIIEDGIPIQKGRFLRFAMLDPEDLWDLSVFGEDDGPGWLLQYPKKEWKKILRQVPDMKPHHLMYLFDKEMCMPSAVAFQVKGRLIAGDGRRRAYIAHMLGEKVEYGVFQGILK